jgi:hypothetical protein
MRRTRFLDSAFYRHVKRIELASSQGKLGVMISERCDAMVVRVVVKARKMSRDDAIGPFGKWRSVPVSRRRLPI